MIFNPGTIKLLGIIALTTFSFVSVKSYLDSPESAKKEHNIQEAKIVGISTEVSNEVIEELDKLFQLISYTKKRLNEWSQYMDDGSDDIEMMGKMPCMETLEEKYQQLIEQRRRMVQCISKHAMVVTWDSLLDFTLLAAIIEIKVLGCMIESLKDENFRVYPLLVETGMEQLNLMSPGFANWEDNLQGYISKRVTCNTKVSNGLRPKEPMVDFEIGEDD